MLYTLILQKYLNVISCSIYLCVVHCWHLFFHIRVESDQHHTVLVAIYNPFTSRDQARSVSFRQRWESMGRSKRATKTRTHLRLVITTGCWNFHG